MGQVFETKTAAGQPMDEETGREGQEARPYSRKPKPETPGKTLVGGLPREVEDGPTESMGATQGIDHLGAPPGHAHPHHEGPRIQARPDRGEFPGAMQADGFPWPQVLEGRVDALGRGSTGHV